MLSLFASSSLLSLIESLVKILIMFLYFFDIEPLEDHRFTQFFTDRLEKIQWVFCGPCHKNGLCFGTIAALSFFVELDVSQSPDHRRAADSGDRGR